MGWVRSAGRAEALTLQGLVPAAWTTVAGDEHHATVWLRAAKVLAAGPSRILAHWHCPGIAGALPLSMHFSTPFPYRIMAPFCKHVPEGLHHQSALGPSHEPAVPRSYPKE